MVTTTPCDESHHEDCSGTGLVQGVQRPPHEPEAEGELVWVSVECGCPCHSEKTSQLRPRMEAFAASGDTTFVSEGQQRNAFQENGVVVMVFVGREYLGGGHDEALQIGSEVLREMRAREV